MLGLRKSLQRLASQSVEMINNRSGCRGGVSRQTRRRDILVWRAISEERQHQMHREAFHGAAWMEEAGTIGTCVSTGRWRRSSVLFCRRREPC